MTGVDISVAPASLLLAPDRELPVNELRSLLEAVSVSPALEAVSAALEAVSMAPVDPSSWQPVAAVSLS
ncbi:hypothetical protein [Microbacterium sp. Bi128]|uniref:hypothetical protein n=1 Tax=Microbacterium sp. Bi128 TaxID=2821115 RepID=UPI001E35D531|nr:hypothetical protein [Microbacterium sp. Bi128]